MVNCLNSSELSQSKFLGTRLGSRRNASAAPTARDSNLTRGVDFAGNDSNLLIVFYVQIMPDDFVMQLHRF